ncbi:MAG: SufE family protein [Armatimonadetes bacterium]|nr:SufE family protein [Armatimonadota bacterium]
MTKLEELICDIEAIADRRERIEALISIGDQFVNEPSAIVPRTEENRVKGCESEVFITAEPGPTLNLHFAVDNPQGISAMAFAQILKECLNGQPTSEAEFLNEEMVYRVFGTELSMGKTAGLTGMIQRVKSLAQLNSQGRPT